MKSIDTSAPRACGRADTTKASMLNAKRIFFIVLSNVGIRLFRRGIYSTSNSQNESASRVFERAHAQKHPNTNQHELILIKREPTTDLNSVFPTPLIEETGKTSR